MKKINILLVCNAGMSTSLLVEKIIKASANHDIKVTVEAQPVDDVKNHLKNRDLILLGPQVRFKEKQIRELVQDQIPVSIIDMAAYGTMNGEKVLEQSMALIENRN
ncbi:PTS sugar transporter subunit IIB [Enterococcus sp. LJL99]